MLHRGVMFQYFEWNCKADGSLWRELATNAEVIQKMGATAVWMPPAYKAMDGIKDAGYATYDLYDLGEFNQKGTVPTKYGTRAEYLAAVNALKKVGIRAYADIVLNHRMGADETEDVEIVEVSTDDRKNVQGEPYQIKAWSHYKFPGRGGQYSAFEWHWQHFTAFGCNAAVKDDCGKIYRVAAKRFSDEVAAEHGNFDYLMGADVDHADPDVNAELLRWGKWYIETTGVDGLRLDAVKHIPASFYKQWLPGLREYFGGRELFSVGEYWSGDVEELKHYLAATDGVMRLFDVPLHYNFHKASEQGRDYDMSKILDGSLVKENPLLAVTFVDNHDSQPGQALESWIADWFKPLAYALVLLRKDGYPCVFYGDYYGNFGEPDGKHKLESHRKMIDLMLDARQRYAFGEQHDYFDHPQCVGWLWSGDAEHPSPLAIVMSTSDDGVKKMKTDRPGQSFRDLTGHWPEPVKADEHGEAEFRCPAGKLGVWYAV